VLLALVVLNFNTIFSSEALVSRALMQELSSFVWIIVVHDYSDIRILLFEFLRLLRELILMGVVT